MVTLEEFARRFGIDRSNARKWLLAAGRPLGIAPTKIRSPEHRQQQLAWSAEDAERLLALRRERGFPLDSESAERPAPRTSTEGVFYVIRLAPDLARCRLKFGFAFNLNQRLADHRCAEPTAEVVTVWPCKAAWEPAALACVRATVGARPVSGEVFDISDKATLIERLTRPVTR